MQELLSRPRASIARSLFTLIAGAAALGACADQNTLTQAKPQDPNRIIICGEGCAGGGGPVVNPPQVTVQVSVPQTQIGIDDPASHAAIVTITNSGGSLGGLTVLASTTQGPTSHAEAGAIPLTCSGASGVLTPGSCSINMAVRAMNADQGHGLFIPGPGAVRVDVTAGGKTYTQTVPVTLTVGMVAVTPSVGNWTIDGPFTRMSSTVTNTGGLPLTNLHYEITATQSGASRTIANVPLLCDQITAPTGTLPGESFCFMKIPSIMSNAAPGFGTLAAGNATITLSLKQGSTVIVQKDFKSIVRVAHVTSASASDTTSVIDGAAHAFKATISAATPFDHAVSVVGVIRQGATQRGAIAGHLSCTGAALDVFHTATCTVTGAYSASNSAAGTGTLIPGAATLSVSLVAPIAEQDTIMTTSIPITLANANTTPPTPAVTISTLNVQGAPVIGTPGPSVPLSVLLTNTGGATANATVRIQVQQGAAARDAGNGTLPLNCGAGNGVIPAAGCTLNTHFAVSNISSGSGTFVPGAATLGVIINDPVAGQIRKFVTIQLTAQ